MKNRLGNIKIAKGGKLKIGKHSVRPEDQTRFTVSALGGRIQKRRRQNKVARASRRANRGR